MKLSQVLTSIKGSGDTVKTASDNTAASSDKTAANTGEKLKAALREVTAAAPTQEKQAATGSPIDGLTKIASQVASAEHESLVKEAQLYGAAVMDGFMARGAQYDAAAQKIAAEQPVQERTAAAPVVDASFEKFAAENPELVKEAAEVGFQTTMIQIEKLAQASYAKGHDEATLGIYKLGHASFVQGFEDTANLIKALR